MLDDGKILGSRFIHSYEDIISVENLLAAWREFVNGKRKKRDVQEFQHRLMDNILELHEELQSLSYKHGPYDAFKVNDPKPRDIHKATVRDRLLHHAIYRQLYPYFNRMFIADSYSCRTGKGTHRAMDRFQKFAYAISRNDTRTCWVLKCDIRKFFASIDHRILMNMISVQIQDTRIVNLIGKIVGSFGSTAEGKGLPLGNLTSQLLVNIYMNRFDQYVKHELRVRHYIRYADDFVFFSPDRASLEQILPKVRHALWSLLKLELHPYKVHIQTLASGVDFLGWVHFPHHRTLRGATKRRMLRNLEEGHDPVKIRSYRGLLSHGNTHKLISTHLQEDAVPIS